MKIELEDHRPVSLNKYYAGMHWTKRKKIVDEIHFLVKTANPKIITKLKFPVTIRILSYQKGRLLDPDNITAKPYIDGLKGQYIPDDNPKYVKGVYLETVKAKYNKLVIEIL